ncbi:MAG: PQQ-binding-like beta-propeller repeat protein [Fuerstiella sp.]|nr:PQQ-binding-like beta-propeller repeat protein [Fuerstiella sp.]
MSNSTSRRDFLKSVGLTVFAVGVGSVAPAQEKNQPQQGASGSETRLVELPFQLMICDYVQFKLSRVDTRGKVIWEHRPEGKVWDFILTGDDKLIYPIITDGQEVRCIDSQKKQIWSWPYAGEFREIINITKHRSQLIVSGQKPPRAILMNLDGTIQKRLPIPAGYNHHHGQLGNVYAVGNKHYLAQLWGEGTALEVDENGKEVWRYQVPKAGKGRYPEGTIQDLLRLDNGNTLLACGTQARLLEVDRSGKIVWEFTGTGHPELNFTNACNLQQLSDGSVLVTNFLRGNSGRGAHAFRLSKEKQITWTFTDHKNFTAISQVWAIEQ